MFLKKFRNGKRKASSSRTGARTIIFQPSDNWRLGISGIPSIKESGIKRSVQISIKTKYNGRHLRITNTDCFSDKETGRFNSGCLIKVINFVLDCNYVM